MNLETFLHYLCAIGILLAVEGHGLGQSISTVQFASAKYLVNENGGTVVLTVERIGEPGATAYVEYATYISSAISGVDYTEQSGGLQFFGETNMTIVIPIQNDSMAEPDESFTVVLFNPDIFDTELGALSGVEVSILDDDRGVEFVANPSTVGEAAGNAILTVRASTESTNAFRVDYFTESCDAIAGVDFLQRSGTLVFARGEKEKTILVPILDDARQEDGETISVRLANPSGIGLGLRRTAVVTIQDNDAELGWTKAMDLAFTPRREGIWSGGAGIPLNVAVAGHHAYVQTFHGNLEILDISNPALPRRVGGCRCASEGSFPFTVAGQFAYMGGYGLQVVDVSDPANPFKVGHAESGVVEGVAVSGGVAYVADWYFGLRVLDVSDPANPVSIGGSAGDGYALGVVQAGHYAYVSDYRWDGQMAHGRVRVIDITHPASPQPVAEIETRGLPRDLAFFADHLLVPSSLGGVEIFDISDPQIPRRVGSYADELQIYRMAVSGRHAYLLDYTGLQVIDLADPANPQPVGAFAGGGAGLGVSGDHAFVVGARGMDVLDIADPAHPRRTGGYDTLYDPQGVAVAEDYAFVADGTGLRVFELQDRANPRLLSDVVTSGTYPNQIVIQCHQAIAAGYGLDLIDISQPTRPQVMGSYPKPPLAPWWVTTLSVEGTWAYLFSRGGCFDGCVDGQVEIVDFSDPSDIRRLGVLNVGYAVGIAVSGQRHYAVGRWNVIDRRSGFAVLDVSDPSNPRTIVSTELTGERIAVAGRHAYIAGGGTLQVVDVSNPASPAVVGNVAQAFAGGQLLDVKVLKGYAYLRDSAGLSIIDLRNPASPRLVSRYEAAGGPFAVFGDKAILVAGETVEMLDLNPPGFRPAALTHPADGQVRLVLSARAGETYALEASTNLVDWHELETRTATDTTLTLTDPDAGRFASRFYRAVSR